VLKFNTTNSNISTSTFEELLAEELNIPASDIHSTVAIDSTGTSGTITVDLTFHNMSESVENREFEAVAAGNSTSVRAYLNSVNAQLSDVYVDSAEVVQPTSSESDNENRRLKLGLGLGLGLGVPSVAFGAFAFHYYGFGGTKRETRENNNNVA